MVFVLFIRMAPPKTKTNTKTVDKWFDEIVANKIKMHRKFFNSYTDSLTKATMNGDDGDIRLIMSKLLNIQSDSMRIYREPTRSHIMGLCASLMKDLEMLNPGIVSEAPRSH